MQYVFAILHVYELAQYSPEAHKKLGTYEESFKTIERRASRVVPRCA